MTDSPENMTLAVTWAGDDRALGTVSIMPRKPGVFEIGYIFARAAWGQGVAHESVACVIDHIFASMRARRIYADTDPDNSGSIALLERLGFVREGYLREEWETHIGVRDTALYGLLKREWNTAERLPHQPVAPAKAGAAGK
jgi:RimJ/RimL family protein N-acetyltransferase